MYGDIKVTPAQEKRGTITVDTSVRSDSIVAVRDMSWRDTLVTFKLWDDWTVQLSFPDNVLETHEELAQYIADSAPTWVKMIRGK
jgi:hypothetical protein